MSKDKKQESYFQNRMKLLGITEQMNKIDVRFYNAEKGENDLKTVPVFRESPKGIDIFVTTINRNPINYAKEGSRWKINEFCITRLEVPQKDEKTGKEKKYHIPRGAGTYPFFHPSLIEKYEKQERIETLILTEGYFKAFKGCMHGLDVVGMSSITHYKDKATQSLHPDILALINICKVKNVILLYDGDCLDISTSALEEGKDLYNRPSGFFSSARNIKELLKDYLKDADIYFAHISRESAPNSPKGLDDLLIELKGKEDLAVKDLLSFSKATSYFYRANITESISKIQRYFHIDNVTSFYNFHQEKIKEKEFVYYGTKYKYSEEKAEVQIIIPGAARNYFRVGDHYHEKIQIPNKYGQFEHVFHKRLKSTITDDHGDKFVKHIPKYKAFCVVPDHINYQEVIHNCYNMYAPFEHEPEDGECETTIEFIKHIFGEQWEKGMDYVQLILQRPTQILPILCLVSKENKTGKTTFAKWLKAIFTQNMAIVGNSDLANDFNATYASRLLICCDEAFIDKKIVIEKIKSLSTADKIWLNAKGRDQVEIDFFGKFILLTNNEDNFVYATEDDIRYWVRKIPVISQEKNILPMLIEEIPAFLNFLNKRQLSTKDVGSRMWFTAKDIETEALKRLIIANQPTVEREIRKRIRDMFFDFGTETIELTNKDICKDFFKNKYEENYVEKIIKNNMKVDTYKNDQGKGVTKRYSFMRNEQLYRDGKPTIEQIVVHGIGRPYVFKREQFLTQEEIAEHVIADDVREETKMLIGKSSLDGAPLAHPVEDKLPF